MKLLPLIALGALCLIPPAASAQNPPAQITYTFENQRLQPSSYTLVLHEDGSGRFDSLPGPASVDASDEQVAPARLDRDIHISDSLRTELFQYARAHHFFAGKCDRGQKKLAFTGKRTLTYAGPDGHGTCDFDWASDATLQRLSDQLVSVAYTLEIGRRLDVELKHNRLSLDAELENLQSTAKDQRAAGLDNIAPVLEAIAGDDAVMQRARYRARTLLNAAAGETAHR
ncbi:hypothetical protein [Paracidobacterium acidisoli]|uniref:DUF2884 family protein n=1 Tax=Paracidobacterium acidisoli TaxID=2303751 RepID=A0A372IQZ8_9BACT|nr:hypothetical protein [Paracidobacterium acidisoli]MBT9330168.1 hypothetical protein [Paracidobacterium acidisoli]